ncbi:MAG TPA: hypothetical protein VM511_01045, partial [Luteolibacter sp.]|nr:hypothetical protein [Luteolibacter sp.]
ILFVGTRNWKSGNPVTALFDVSDIRSLFSQAEKADESTAAKKPVADEAPQHVEGSLIEKGILVRRSSQLTAANVPVGLSRDIARH